MKLKFKNTPEQVELIKAMGSKHGSFSKLPGFAALSAGISAWPSRHGFGCYTDVVYGEDDNLAIRLIVLRAKNMITT